MGIDLTAGRLRFESDQNWTGTITVNPGTTLDTYGHVGNVRNNGPELIEPATLV